MKKVHVIEKYFLPVTAGIEVNTFQTYSKLADRWDITFHVSTDTLTEKNVLPFEEIIGKLRIKRYIFGKLSYWPKINWQEADIVALHNFNVMPHALVMLYSIWLKLLGKKHYKLFLTPHGGFNPEWSIFPLPIRIAKKLYHYTVGVILINLAVDGMRAVSEWEGTEILKKHVNKKIVRVISNGIEDEAYIDNESQSSEEIKVKVKEYGRYIIQIGRVYVIKNYETVIRALPNMPEDIKFLIVGPVELNYHDDYKTSLEKLAQELGVADRVLFLGVIKGIDKYYLIKKAQLMVHMAKWESFCNVVHEGMSQGLPIVCSNTYALPYLVKNGVNGFILDVTDSYGVADRVNYILDNMQSTEIIQMKKLNQEFALAHSWTKVAEKMYEFYMENLND